MVLNIFPRRERPQSAPAIEPEQSLPEPSIEALDEPLKKTTRRGTRGGRGRRKPGVEGVEATQTEATEDAPAELPVRARRTRGSAKATAEAEASTSDEPVTTAPAAPRRAPAARKASAPPPAETGPIDLAALVRTIEAQGRQIEQLVRATEDAGRRTTGGSAATVSGAPPARIGVFVDAANVELAFDRLRARADWRKVLALLTDGRNLVRAISYSPVHDDPGVSLETQRFAEPFLGKGYKVVTKPLKRFADGTIKANVDIEMALDIIEMLDRLDVVCLVSGDGDFQRLVEVVQAKGVRVEVAAVGTSTAANLRNAADSYIDLQGVLAKIRV